MDENSNSESTQVVHKQKQPKGRLSMGLVVVLILLGVGNIFVGMNNASTIAEMSKSVISMQESIESSQAVLVSSVQEFNETSKIIRDNSDSQTALLYRTIGDVLPVVVPDKSRAEFETVKQAVATLRNQINDDNLSKAVELYTDFIQTTAPWIQEELSQEILEAKNDIDYSSILNTYNTNKDAEEVADSLQTFIVSNSGYSRLQTVIAKYNEIVDEQNALYDKEVASLMKRTMDIIKTKNASYSEWESLLKDMEPYQNDEALAKCIPELYTCMTEAERMKEIIDEADKLYKQLTNDDGSLYDQMYSVYANRLADYMYEASSIENLDSTKLMETLKSCMTKLNAYEELGKQKERETLFAQLENSVKTCSTEIDGMSSNPLSQSMLPVISSQLATLKLATEGIEGNSREKTNILSEIENCVAKLKRFESLSQSSGNNEAKVKSYNSTALNTIEGVNATHNGLSGNKAEKTASRKNLLRKLEAIETGYLYAPIYILHQQVYQDIWGKLERDDQLDYSRTALNITKETL